MARRFVEVGIGENRHILVENDRIAHAAVDWNETLIAGSRVRARVMPRQSGAVRGLVMTPQGEAILVRGLKRTHTQGSEITAEIRRAAIGEDGRAKPAQGIVTDLPERRWTHVERIRSNDPDLQTVRQFPIDGWEDIVALALSRQADFAGGSLTLSPTPAMTLIDVDGYLPPLALCLAAVPEIADVLRKLDIRGSIGIDFPTLQTREDRQKVDRALAEALRDHLFERTAMNGFGFVQLVGRVEGPSILHRYTYARTGACARIALRQAERLDGPGVTLIAIHPAIRPKLKPQWLDELQRRTGRPNRIETDSGLALEAPHAQIVSA